MSSSTAQGATSPPLAGTVAVIAGASSGIGLATAHALSRSGASVVLLGRRADRVQAGADEMTSRGATALALQVDISDRDAAEAAVAKTVSEFGRLDILVNSAGHGGRAAVLDSTPTEWDAMIAANVQGALYTMHAALPHLVEAAKTGTRGVADIVNVSSLVSRMVWANYASYSMTKAGLNAFTHSLREELAEHMVRTSLVEPGGTDTEMIAAVNTSRAAATVASTGYKLLEANDVADAVHYIVTRPAHVSVNEFLVRPTAQSFAPPTPNVPAE